MKKSKSLSVLLAGTLVLSILAPQRGYAVEEKGFFDQAIDFVVAPVRKAVGAVQSITHEILNIHVSITPEDVVETDVNLVNEVLSTVTPDVQDTIKELVAVWVSKGLSISPSAQIGLIKVKGQTEILDLAEKDLSMTENSALELLAALHFENKLISFVSSLVEVLKQDPKYAHLVTSVGVDQKLIALSMLDQTISSTEYLRKFSKQTWTELSQDLELNLNLAEGNAKSQTRLSHPNFMIQLQGLANSKFVKTESTQLLVNGPASFSLRDQKMLEAKESINMITWAVLDDKTGQELADLLIAKVKEGVKVRLIVDGQVSQRGGYRREVSRMEKNGVAVVHWVNPDAKFMGQHRKILIIDESLVIMGGMNPGDTYSHKAGDIKNRWRDTDIAVKGDLVKDTQRIFTRLWNKQVIDQKLAFAQINQLFNPPKAALSGDRAMLIDHQPKASKDQHEIILTTMKAIRGAEKTVDIENAYVIAFPSLLLEIKAAVARGVKVRVLTNSTESVDEPVVALPMVRSAKKLLDVGAEVYLKKGSTLHSKFMIVDQRLLMIGSYNYHPRSEKMEGEAVAVFDNVNLATVATAAFTNDILPENAMKMDPAQNIVIPINGTTLLPLRMFYDQL